MKIIILYAAMSKYEHGLNKIIKIVRTTLEELGVVIEEVNLSLINIPYYDGVKSQSVENIFNTIKASDGVVFASSSRLSAPCAIMQTFLEHFDYGVYGEILSNKNCYVITTSNDESERKASEYINSVIYSLGGSDSCNISIGNNYQKLINKDKQVNEIIEKYTEDFYRIIRQNRKFFKFKSTFSNENDLDILYSKKEKEYEDEEFENKIIEDISNNQEKINPTQFTKLFGYEPKAGKTKKEQLMQKIDLTNFNENQKEDINEITKMITSQYGENLNKQSKVSDLYKLNSKLPSNETVANIKTCKQRTQNLCHYFQPQISGNLDTIIQINIKGTEKFECYLIIKDSECTYYDGIYDDPDVTVFTDTKVWNDILDGKFTTQKAFMIGQLKVRGNFVILTKFDQIFKIHV